MGNSQMSFFSQNTLTNNINEMTTDQLKERLMVAETLLKRLYSKNKELESQPKQ